MAEVAAGARFQLLAGPAGRPPVRELTKATSISCTWRLAPSHELSFTIPARVSLEEVTRAQERGTDPRTLIPEAAAVRELVDDVHLLLDGVPLYTGRVGQPTDNPSDVAHTRTVATADYRAMLGRRFWRTGQVTFKAEQASVIGVLVAAAQDGAGGSLGIATDQLPNTGQYSNRVTETGANILEEIKALASAGVEGDATTPGFDWDITAGWTGRRLQVWYPGRGKSVNPFVYRWHPDPLAQETSVLKNLTRTTNPGDYANAVLVTGGTKVVKTTTTTVDPSTGQTIVKVTTEEFPTLPVYRAVTGIETRPEGLWMQTLSYPDIVDQTELQAKADERLAALATITPSWSFELDLAVWLDLGGPAAYWLGDQVPVIVSSGVVDDDLTLRVTEIRLTLDGNGGGRVAFTLGPPRGGALGFIASLGPRLAAVELRA